VTADMKWTYKIEFLSPVHIGSGDRLGRDEYVVKNDQLYVVDLDQILAQPRVTPEKLAKELSDGTPMNTLLNRFSINPTRVSRYHIGCGNWNMQEVLLAVKNAFQQPYLPGSSLKGAIRSALLWKAFSQQDWTQTEGQIEANLSKVRREIHRRKCTRDWAKGQMAEGVEEIVFGADPNHDLLRALQVGDTEAVEPDMLQVVQVKVFTRTRDGGHQCKKYQLYSEAFSQRASLKGSIKIAEYLFADLPTVKPMEELGLDKTQHDLLHSLVQVCQEYAAQQIDAECQFYESCNMRDVARWYADLKQQCSVGDPNTFLLQVGWGTGSNAKVLPQLRNTRLSARIRLALDMGKIICGACDKEVTPDKRDANRWYCSACHRTWASSEVKVLIPYPKTRRLAVIPGTAKPEKYLPMGWVRVHLERRTNGSSA
jgi:CRISPR-associated protein Csm5